MIGWQELCIDGRVGVSQGDTSLAEPSVHAEHPSAPFSAFAFIPWQCIVAGMNVQASLYNNPYAPKPQGGRNGNPRSPWEGQRLLNKASPRTKRVTPKFWCVRCSRFWAPSLLFPPAVPLLLQGVPVPCRLQGPAGGHDLWKAGLP